MKILKSIFVLVLFSNFIISCTVDDITEDSEINQTEIQATGENNAEDDQTEKG